MPPLATSVVEFLGCIEGHVGEAMFRGQSDIAWPLLPSIARFASAIDGYDCISDIEDHLLEKFRHFAIPFNDFRKIPVIEQLVHAQHYGLPTRLMDWSTNPLKALFFAVEQANMDAVDGVVYITRPVSWMEGTAHVKSLDNFLAFYPELLHERIAAQDACLLAFPLSKTDKSVPELSEGNVPEGLEILEKMVIPAAAKQELRRQLSAVGVSHRTVFPGLEGTTRWIRSDLSNFAT